MSAKRKVVDVSMQHFGGIGNGVQSLTGSCHNLIIEYDTGEKTSIIIDVGAFQGLGQYLNQSLLFEVDSIDAVIVTHGHIDHCGRLPMLLKQTSVEDDEILPFHGKIFASELTAKVAHIALLDSAKIFTNDFKIKDKRYKKLTGDLKIARRTATCHEATGVKRDSGGNRNESHNHRPEKRHYDDARKLLDTHGVMNNADIYANIEKPEPPLFEVDDVEAVMKDVAIVSYSEKKKVVWQEICPEVSFSIWNAGHVAGSSSVLIRVTTEKAKVKYYFFSGDLGPYRTPIHPFGFAEVPDFPLDMVVMETTYGDKVRQEFEVGYQKFEASVIKASTTRERLIIPCFALDRAQQVLSLLVKMQQGGKFEGEIFLDSPLATEYTKLYHEHGSSESGMDLLKPGPTTYSVLDSLTREEALSAKGFKVVVTSSGMATGGPIMTYLAEYLGGKPNGHPEDLPDTTFVFMGYMAEGTLGRDLTDEYNPKKIVSIMVPNKADKSKMELKKIIVKARVKRFNFISGHMDQTDLWGWYKKLRLLPTARVVLVHGEIDSSTQEFKNFLRRRSYDAIPHKGVVIPEADKILTPDVNDLYSVFS